MPALCAHRPVANQRGGRIETMRVGVRPFDPRWIAGVRLYLAATHVRGQVDGGATTTWHDLSGYGIHVSQATSTKRPLLKMGIINGRPVLRFDATDDCLTATFNLNGLTGLSVFVVGSSANDASDRVFVEHDTTFNASGDGFILYRVGVGQAPTFFISGNVGSSGWAHNTAVTTTPVVLAGVADRTLSTGEAKIWRNGSLGVTSAENNNTNTFGNHTLNIGSRNNGGSLPLSGDIASVVIVGRAVFPGERNIMTAFLGRSSAISVV